MSVKGDEARKRMADMDVLEKSIDTLLDTFLEGVDEVAGRLNLDRADTLNVLGRYSKRVGKWMVERWATLDAGGGGRRADPTDAALLGAVMRQPGSGTGIGSFGATVHAWGPAASLPISPGVETPPTREELVAELVLLRRSNRLRGERADRERVKRRGAEYRLRAVCGMLADGMDADDVLAYVARVLSNVGNGVQRMGGATGDAP